MTMRTAENLRYPSIDAVITILQKLGIDPASRDLDCQDFEYTTCRMEELELYLELYQRSDTTIYEKRVLGCYFMEGLNDFVSEYQVKHKIQDQLLELLYRDIEIHRRELNYRIETDDPHEEHWWPIRKYVIEWRAIHGT
jgi:hypothetical protein